MKLFYKYTCQCLTQVITTPGWCSMRGVFQYLSLHSPNKQTKQLKKQPTKKHFALYISNLSATHVDILAITTQTSDTTSSFISNLVLEGMGGSPLKYNFPNSLKECTSLKQTHNTRWSSKESLSKVLIALMPNYQQGKGELGCTHWDALWPQDFLCTSHLYLHWFSVHWLPAPGACRTPTAGDLSIHLQWWALDSAQLSGQQLDNLHCGSSNRREATSSPPV